MKRIVLTGGGTAGHVTPNIALIPKLQKEGWEINYIGTKQGIEKNLIEELNIPYYGISSGKLRRYFDIKNFTDPFRVLKGFTETIKIIRKIKPTVVFSKGGFVSVPVVIASRMLGVPVIIHESDITPGLANKIVMPFSTRICVNFPETLEYIPNGKGILTGTPIREELLKGQKEKGLKMCNFVDKKPVIMMIGGSLGSVKINKYLRTNLKEILKDFQVVHICGKGNIDKELESLEGYKQFEYVKEELCDIYAMSDMILSRAGANVIYEILYLQKPNILIPLSANASRGDQILNAKSFEKQGFSKVLKEEQLKGNVLVNEIKDLYNNKNLYISNMKKTCLKNGIDEIMKTIRTV